jgi:hypothetical protein
MALCKWSDGWCLRIAMLIVRAHASETARMEILVAIEDTLQKVMLSVITRG